MATKNPISAEQLAAAGLDFDQEICNSVEIM